MGVLFQCLDIILHYLINPRKNWVFFESLGGQYNDNPKYISVALHELHPEIRQFWAISNRSKQNDIPDYVTIVQFNSIKYFFVKNTCRVIVENGAGNYIYHTNNKIVYKVKNLLKNRRQLDLATWHGNPIKHIGAQEPCNANWTKDSIYTTADYMLSGASFITDIFKRAYFNLIPILQIGTPRTDILFDSQISTKYGLRKKLGLPLDKNVILFAPTFRYTPEDSGVRQLTSFDYEKLFKCLHERFGGEWCFVFRVHNMVLQSLDTEAIVREQKMDGRIINGNQFDDMNEYLAASDILISDYSGCIYDVALTEKPCFLFAHDREHYESSERGLYAPISLFPYTFADTFEQLLEDIKQYDSHNTNIKRTHFLEQIGNIEKGQSANAVVNFIIDYLGE